MPSRENSSSVNGDALAIVGIGMRLPPAAASLGAFWRFLLRGGDATRRVPADRWDWRQYWDEDSSRPGKSHAAKAGWLDFDMRQFDPEAFGMSPREAACLDPQQRILLESTWEAFDDAGLPMESVRGTATGVFIGGFCLDHLLLQTNHSNLHLVDAHTPGGVMMTVLSNRLSHAFDLRGPSISMDTACSSSLVAIHSACQSLRLGECTMAIAGGVNVMMRPEFPVIMSKGHFLSHHGECRTFDESAAGYARGEGCGVLLIRRLADALADGNQIHALIAASGVNQDGRTEGLSLPNSDAQEALIRSVYARAGIDPTDVAYVEAHGTGTQAGDPAELKALSAVLGRGRDGKSPLWVGSVKSNIGHLEAAAGIAGMIKAIGILKFRRIPRNLHFNRPNPRIPFDEYAVQVPVETVDLPSADEAGVLRIGVNSFGYGGTNAHVVLESAPVRAADASAEAISGPQLVPYSARSEPALRELLGKMAFVMGQEAGATVADLAFTAGQRRSHHPVRCAIVARDKDHLRTQLIAGSTGEVVETMVVSRGTPPEGRALAFVLTGMGPQWWAMGQELLVRQPVFREAIEEIEEVFLSIAGWSLVDEMRRDEANTRMSRTEVAQTANFALQAGLLRMFQEWGIRPSAIVGHSVGEVSAAYAAGIYSLRDAVAVSFHRSRLQQQLAGRGAMLAVGCSEDRIASLIDGFADVSIAAINSFDSVTLSGDRLSLDVIAARLTEQAIFNKFLRVEVAYHSPQMEVIREELLETLASLDPGQAKVPLFSTVEGELTAGGQWTAVHWWNNVRQPVRFAKATQSLLEFGCTDFLEIGPHPVLGPSIQECAITLGRPVNVFQSLRRNEPELERILRTVGELYCSGYDPDWKMLGPKNGRFIAGPQYPWQRERHWIESEQSRIDRCGEEGAVYLNRPVSTARPTWEVEINGNYFPFLRDHSVQRQTVFAGMGYLDAALTAGRRILACASIRLEDVAFERVLVIDPQAVQILVTEIEPDAGRFLIASRRVGDMGVAQRQCSGRIFSLDDKRRPDLDADDVKSRCHRAVSTDDFYGNLDERGIQYGPSFRPTEEICVCNDEFWIRLTLTDEMMDHVLHPAIFDAAIQPVLYCAEPERLFVPFAIDRFEFFGSPAQRECVAIGRLTLQTETTIIADVSLLELDGTPIARATGLTCRRVNTGTPSQQAELLVPRWIEIQRSGEPRDQHADSESWHVWDAGGADELAERLASVLPGQLIGSNPDEESIRGLIVVVPSEANLIETEICERFVRMLQKFRETLQHIVMVSVGARAIEHADGSNPMAAALEAIARVAASERNGLVCRFIDLPADYDWETICHMVAAEVRSSNPGTLAFRSGGWFELQYHRAQQDELSRSTQRLLDDGVALQTVQRGGREQLALVAETPAPPDPSHVRVRVHRALLSLSAGRSDSGEMGGGNFCVGVALDGRGDRFRRDSRVAVIADGVFRSHVQAEPSRVVSIPDGIDWDVAATALDYAAARRLVFRIARLDGSHRVLLSGDLGGLAVALREFISSVGAKLDIGAKSPNGERYDCIFGTWTGGARSAALNALRPGGCYVDLAPFDHLRAGELSLRAFADNLTYTAFNVDRWVQKDPDATVEEVRMALDFLAASSPQQDHRVLPVADLVDRSLGDESDAAWKLVDLVNGSVEIQDGARTLVREDGTYLVTGGTSGLGLSLGLWLAGLGAGRVILLSRSGAAAPDFLAASDRVASFGESVVAISADITDPEAVRSAVQSVLVSDLPIRGVVHCAMVLSDALLDDVDPNGFRRVWNPKVCGALSLLECVEAQSLDFLVFCSSVSAVIGNRGQTSYAAANAALDSLAVELRRKGVPATSINWGALGETGVVARDGRLANLLESGGIQTLPTRDALGILQSSISSGLPQLAALRMDWNRFFAANDHLASDPRFRPISDRLDGNESEPGYAIRRELADAPAEVRHAAVADHLLEVLAQTLRTAPERLPRDRRLADLGVDSLMVLELGLGIQQRLGITFSAMDFLKGPTLDQLATMARSRLWEN